MRAFLALMVSGAGALSITRRGVAARVGVAVTTGEFLRTRDARAAYDYNVESYGVGADRNAVDAPQPQQMVMPGSARAASPRAVAASRSPVPPSRRARRQQRDGHRVQAVRGHVPVRRGQDRVARPLRLHRRRLQARERSSRRTRRSSRCCRRAACSSSASTSASRSEATRTVASATRAVQLRKCRRACLCTSGEDGRDRARRGRGARGGTPLARRASSHATSVFSEDQTPAVANAAKAVM